MTTFSLQNELKKEIERILQDFMMKNPKGELVHIQTFGQNLPKQMQKIQTETVMDEEAQEDDLYPFCVVRMDSGSMGEHAGVHTVKTVLIFGIWDNDLGCQGHQVILNMIQRISGRFFADPILSEKYAMDESAGINWTLDDEDQFPYYYGAMEMTWHMLLTKREEDKYA